MALLKVTCEKCGAENLVNVQNHGEMIIGAFNDKTNNIIGEIPTVGLKGENKMTEREMRAVISDVEFVKKYSDNAKKFTDNELMSMCMADNSVFDSLYEEAASAERKASLESLTPEQRVMLEKMSTYMSTYNSVNASTSNLDLIDPTARRMSEDGYIKNMFHRRYITAQTFDLFGWRDGCIGEDKWNENFKRLYGYHRIWEITKDELKRLANLEEKDRKAFEEEVQFFDRNVIIETMRHYVGYVLTPYINSLQVHKCKGVPYVHIGKACFTENRDMIEAKYSYVNTVKRSVLAKNKNVFKVDLTDRVYKVEDVFINLVRTAESYREIYEVFSRFTDRTCNPYFITNLMTWKLRKPEVWVDAFKGAGAYYSMDNLIKFSGLKLKNYKTGELLGTQDSLAYLKEQAASTKGERYKLLALLKESLIQNDFNFNEIIKK